MRGSVLLVLLCVSGIAAANPFLGTWDAELVFNNDPVRLEFLSDEDVRISVGTGSVDQIYQWSANTRQLNLGQVEGVVLDSHYQFIEDTVFVLYFGTKMKEALARQMVFDVPAGANQLTQDFARLLLGGIMDSLDHIPIMRAERVQ